MSTRRVVRCIGNRVFKVMLEPHATEAQLEIEVFDNEVEACVSAQGEFVDESTYSVADYYIVRPGFSRKSIVCSEMRSCGMSPYWLHTGHVLVERNYTSNNLIKYLGCDYSEGRKALDDIDDYFKSSKRVRGTT